MDIEKAVKKPAMDDMVIESTPATYLGSGSKPSTYLGAGVNPQVAKNLGEEPAQINQERSKSAGGEGVSANKNPIQDAMANLDVSITNQIKRLRTGITEVAKDTAHEAGRVYGAGEVALGKLGQVFQAGREQGRMVMGERLGAPAGKRTDDGMVR
jgi:hypothetical protein